MQHIRIFAFIIFLLLSFESNSQIFSGVTYAGGTHGDLGHKILHLPNNETIVVGVGFFVNVDFDPGPSQVIVNSGTIDKLFVAKYDMSGNLLWVKTPLTVQAFGDQIIEIKYSQTTNSFFVLIGQRHFDPYSIVKLDSLGDLIWNLTLSPSGSDDEITAFDFAIANDESIYISGSFTETHDFDPGPGQFNLTPSPLSNYVSPFIMKLDSSRNFIWAKKFSSPGSAGSYGNSLVFLNDSSLLVGADKDLSQMEIYRFDSAGNQLGYKYISTPSAYADFKFEVLSDSSIFLYGNIRSPFVSVDFDPDTGHYSLPIVNETFFIAEYDTALKIKWASVIPTSQNNSTEVGLRGITADTRGNIYATGFYKGTIYFGLADSVVSNEQDILLLKYDTAGSLEWHSVFGSGNNDRGYDIEANSDDQIFVCGLFSDSVDMDLGPGLNYIYSNGGWDYWMSNFYSDSLPTSIIHIIGKNSINIFPNPTTGIIHFIMDTKESVSAEIFSLDRRKVYRTNVSGNGIQEIDLSAVESGMYILQLNAGSSISTEKIIIRK